MAEYICREAIIEDLEKEIEAGDAALDEDVWINKGLRIAIRDIKDLKAADVQPVKHGQWFQYNRNGEETYIECTNCCVPSRPRHLQMVTRTGEGLPDYCPNCGAMMDKE